MRFIFMFLLIVIAVVLLAFCVVNRESADVQFPFMEMSVTAPLFLIMLAVYGLGMISGWTVIGAIRSTIHHASDRGRQ